MRGNPRSLRRVFLGSLAGILLLAPGASAVTEDYLHITPVIYGTLGTNGWYVSNVTINWTFDAVPPVLETVGCEAKTLSADTLGTELECRARNDLNAPTDWVSAKKTFRIDKIAPAVSVFPSRMPDANGWYNRALAVAFSGTDATSGIESCSSGGYGGPDNAAAVVAGLCRDKAGNAGGASFSFKYDATPPTLFAVAAKLGNRSAEVAWRKSADTQLIEVLRAPGRNGQGETVVYRGSETGFRDTGLVVGRKYEYRVAGVDEAANRAEHKVDLVATGALLSPAPAERVTSPPNLVWTAAKGASYYNVQLFFRGRKVLSAWPVRPSFRLRRTWVYNGRRYRLRAGVYRWYVWPGIGRISANRFGRMLGSSTFVVAG